MFHFLELEQLSKVDGWSAAALLALFHPIVISFLGTTVFAILGAQALHRQIKRIKTEGAGSVSVEWNIVFLAMFASLMPYGFERESLALVVQCALRTPFYGVIMWRLYRFHGNFTSFQWALIALMTVATGLALAWPTVVATALLWVSVVTAAHQPWKIWRTKSVAGVEPRVLVVYLASAVFWTTYGLATTDYFIVSWAVGYLVVYTSGVVVYRVYRTRQEMVTNQEVM